MGNLVHTNQPLSARTSKSKHAWPAAAERAYSRAPCLDARGAEPARRLARRRVRRRHSPPQIQKLIPPPPPSLARVERRSPSAVFSLLRNVSIKR